MKPNPAPAMTPLRLTIYTQAFGSAGKTLPLESKAHKPGGNYQLTSHWSPIRSFLRMS